MAAAVAAMAMVCLSSPSKMATPRARMVFPSRSELCYCFARLLSAFCCHCIWCLVEGLSICLRHLKGEYRRVLRVVLGIVHPVVACLVLGVFVQMVGNWSRENLWHLRWITEFCFKWQRKIVVVALIIPKWYIVSLAKFKRSFNP